MPLPLFLIAGAVAGLTGVGVSSYWNTKHNNEDAHNLRCITAEKYKKCRIKHEIQHRRADCEINALNETILKTYSEDIGTFVDVFRSFNRIDLEIDPQLNNKFDSKVIKFDDFIKDLKLYAKASTKMLKSGVEPSEAAASIGYLALNITVDMLTTATVALASPIFWFDFLVSEAESEENLEKTKAECAAVEGLITQMKTEENVMKAMEDIASEDRQFIIRFSANYMQMLENVRAIREKEYENQRGILNKIRVFLGLRVKLDYSLFEEYEKQYIYYMDSYTGLICYA